MSDRSRGMGITRRQLVLKDLPAGWALPFAGSRYCSDVRILQSVLSDPPFNNSIPKVCAAK